MNKTSSFKAIWGYKPNFRAHNVVEHDYKVRAHTFEINRKTGEERESERERERKRERERERER